MSEEWVDIPGYAGRYGITRDGEVWSYFSNQPMKPQLSNWGYLFVHLRLGREIEKNEFIHCLLMKTFVGPANGLVVRHLDGDPANNSLANLRYGTQSENLRDEVHHGTHYWASRTVCSRGHAFDAANTRVRKSGGRVCRACHNERGRAAYWRAKAAA